MEDNERLTIKSQEVKWKKYNDWYC